jgi:hypothetical protein
MLGRHSVSYRQFNVSHDGVWDSLTKAVIECYRTVVMCVTVKANCPSVKECNVSCPAVCTDAKCTVEASHPVGESGSLAWLSTVSESVRAVRRRDWNSVYGKWLVEPYVRVSIL